MDATLRGYFLAFACLHLVCAAYNDIVLNTTIGIIHGLVENVTRNGSEHQVLKFLGIPYAEAPTGENRFKKPVPLESLASPYHATTMKSACWQVENIDRRKMVDQSEDCLYLNIYIPGTFKANKITRYPVMVYIHGDNFVSGAANFYSGDILASFYDVIIVTFNYRLSLFGFLSTEEENSKGNYGLWDQQMAIMWVHENIAEFGGNTNAITLMGSSAGGASALLQALYAGNDGLFQRVISLSGSPLAPWATSHQSKLKDPYFTLNCTDSAYESFLDCLRTLKEEDLVQAMNKLEPFQFLPTGDDFFLPQPVAALIESISQESVLFHEVDFLTGVNNLDGLLFLQRKLPDILGTENFSSPDCIVSRDQFQSKTIPFILENEYGFVSEAMRSSTILQYTNWQDPENNNTRRNNLVNLSTDYNFLVPAVKIANQHVVYSTTAKTFFYEFRLRPSSDTLSPAWVLGAVHGVETDFIFGFSPEMRKWQNMSEDFKPTDEEKTLANHIATAFTNFAKTGNPNRPVELPVIWSEYTRESMAYIALNTGMTQDNVNTHIGGSRVAFWVELLPFLEELALATPPSCPTAPLPPFPKSICSDRLKG
ncbi:hypothetical protein CHS0354_011851 [Potamilus streckersoni]|uniref:Carboxylic ester hydrolase n=1 Tax=Potamilus streckersoni TaxID=2493646 RepID=A0AAE0SEA2_9BIVA|nr:hypothetical protein CHS0354_011851 [Potamilus streckersoni]